MWFMPVITAIGDGIEWEINVDEAAIAADPIANQPHRPLTGRTAAYPPGDDDGDGEHRGDNMI